ncbi:MAG TPA: family 43 glycosylhydrolase [Thermoplasmata archaeon]|nr:family 43 glycosylhydrolase [Thermoplasmata archaeon]
MSEEISWVGRFEKYQGNPILSPRGTGFEAMAVFNPAIILNNGKFYMFYRAEAWCPENWEPWNVRPEGWTEEKEWPGISVIGLAVSNDGISFKRTDKPLIIPEYRYENIGGCEDPRIVKIEDTFYLTYTGVGSKNRISKLCLATSKDLINWEKCGPIIDWDGAKSGAIIPEKINGKYWMYFGDTNIWLANSKDLIHWKCDKEKDVVLRPREGYFDSKLVEPGPAPIMTEDGILLIYNGATKGAEPRMGHYTCMIGQKNLRKYATGWALFSKTDSSKLIARCEKPILEVTEDFERNGQVSNVVFAEGLVKKEDKYYLYYGCADTYIGVALSEG